MTVFKAVELDEIPKGRTHMEMKRGQSGGPGANQHLAVQQGILWKKRQNRKTRKV